MMTDDIHEGTPSLDVNALPADILEKPEKRLAEGDGLTCDSCRLKGGDRKKGYCIRHKMEIHPSGNMACKNFNDPFWKTAKPDLERDPETIDAAWRRIEVFIHGEACPHKMEDMEAMTNATGRKLFDILDLVIRLEAEYADRDLATRHFHRIIDQWKAGPSKDPERPAQGIVVRNNVAPPWDIYDEPLARWVLARYENKFMLITSPEGKPELHLHDGTKHVLDETNTIEGLLSRAVDDLVAMVSIDQRVAQDAFNAAMTQQNADMLKSQNFRLKSAKSYWDDRKMTGLKKRILTRITASARDFDKDVNLINTPDRVIVIDKKHRCLAERPHSPSDRFFKCTSVKVNRQAKSPKWDALLKMAADGKPEVEKEIRRQLAHCLLRTPPKKIFRWRGKSDTVKTTILMTMKNVLNHNRDDFYKTAYVYKAPQDFFTMEKNQQATRNDVWQSENCMVTWIDEPKLTQGGEDKAFAKDWTGGGAVNTRALYKGYKSIINVSTTFITANKLPPSAPDDTGMLTRDVVVPFTHVIPKKDQIEKYWDVLANEEGEGILNSLLTDLEAILREDGSLHDLCPEILEETEKYNYESEIVAKCFDRFFMYAKDEKRNQKRMTWAAFKKKLFEYCDSESIPERFRPRKEKIVRTLERRGITMVDRTRVDGVLFNDVLMNIEWKEAPPLEEDDDCPILDLYEKTDLNRHVMLSNVARWYAEKHPDIKDMSRIDIISRLTKEIKADPERYFKHPIVHEAQKKEIVEYLLKYMPEVIDTLISSGALSSKP